MEVHINMTVKQPGVDLGTAPSFWLIGMHPGAMWKDFQKGYHWLEVGEDRNILPIGNLMEIAFKVNRMVVFKKPDLVTHKLIEANLKRTRMDAEIAVAIKTGKGDFMWVGAYGFVFFIERMLANQSDEDGNKWETLQLRIINGTETLALD